MARTFNGTSDFIDSDVPVIIPTTYPISLAAWYKTASTIPAAAAEIVVGFQDEDGSPSLLIEMTTAGLVQARTVNQFGNSTQGNVSGAISTDTWTHFAGTFNSDSNRTAYKNGIAGTTNTSGSGIAANFTLMSEIRIGRRLTAYANGDIAEVGFWNALLTSAEISSLAKGVSPLKIRPQNLILYAPLIRNLIDLKGSTLTATGTTISDHPSVYVY